MSPGCHLANHKVLTICVPFHEKPSTMTPSSELVAADGTDLYLRHRSSSCFRCWSFQVLPKTFWSQHGVGPWVLTQGEQHFHPQLSETCCDILTVRPRPEMPPATKLHNPRLLGRGYRPGFRTRHMIGSPRSFLVWM